MMRDKTEIDFIDRMMFACDDEVTKEDAPRKYSKWERIDFISCAIAVAFLIVFEVSCFIIS